MAPIKKSVVITGVVIVAALVGLVKFFSPSKSDDGAKMTPRTSGTDVTPVPIATQPETPAVTKMMEGTSEKLSVKTHYSNPGGGDDVAFTLTVDQSGVITDATTEVLATHGISQLRQKSFADALPTLVKGKKLSDLGPLDRVGGSSLTTNAFNTVLPGLKAKL